MGSRSRSSTSRSTTTNQTSNVTNKNISGIEDSILLSEVDDVRVDISQTDLGAIKRSFDSTDKNVDRALDTIDDGLGGFLQFGTEIIDNQQQQITETLKSINAANAVSADLDGQRQLETVTEVSKYAAYALVAISTVYLISRMRKK